MSKTRTSWLAAGLAMLLISGAPGFVAPLQFVYVNRPFVGLHILNIYREPVKSVMGTLCLRC
jgi:hypothetical protein